MIAWHLNTVSFTLVQAESPSAANCLSPPFTHYRCHLFLVAGAHLCNWEICTCSAQPWQQGAQTAPSSPLSPPPYVALQDATPKGGSTPHKVPSTPSFTSPREETIHHQHSTSLNSQQSGSVLSGSTPFASLSGCPFPDGDMSSVCTTILEQGSDKGPRGGIRQDSLGVRTERIPPSQSAGTERSQGDTPSSLSLSASFQTAGSLPILAESSQVCSSCRAEQSCFEPGRQEPLHLVHCSSAKLPTLSKASRRSLALLGGVEPHCTCSCAGHLLLALFDVMSSALWQHTQVQGLLLAWFKVVSPALWAAHTECGWKATGR